jgi:nitroimidazol reductase NimA-like FMN-containing flavoprotein (pyridoxamine 5'-phosphate oxidase superfamily)
MPQASLEAMSESTPNTRVHRHPERGSYDKETIYPILDAARVGHVAFVLDEKPYVIPMLVARKEDELLLHGSTASRLMRYLATGADVCVEVTHLDAFVIARSVFDHSMNYRSAVVMGRARSVTDPAEKLEAMRVIVEHLVPGRWDEARQPIPKELKATAILALPIDEASAKVRTGPPTDEPDDYDLPIWAGVVPIRTTMLQAEPDPLLKGDIPIADSVRRLIEGESGV